MTTVAALVAGLATSLHCAGMCGPIACGLGTLAKSEGERLTAASLYHGTRLVSYGIIGAVCGALGVEDRESANEDEYAGGEDDRLSGANQAAPSS